MGGEDGDGIGNILSFIFISYFSIINNINNIGKNSFYYLQN